MTPRFAAPLVVPSALVAANPFTMAANVYVEISANNIPIEGESPGNTGRLIVASRHGGSHVVSM